MFINITQLTRLSVAKLHSINKRTVIMPSTRRHSYNLNFKLKIVAEAVNNNREIAREYGILESLVRIWRNHQHVLFSGKLKMTACPTRLHGLLPGKRSRAEQTGSAIKEVKVKIVYVLN